MYQHLLIATDGSGPAQKAITQGLALAAALHAKVTIVHVTEPWRATIAGEMAFGFAFVEHEIGAASKAEGIFERGGQSCRRDL